MTGQGAHSLLRHVRSRAGNRCWLRDTPRVVSLSYGRGGEGEGVISAVTLSVWLNEALFMAVAELSLHEGTAEESRGKRKRSVDYRP